MAVVTIFKDARQRWGLNRNYRIGYSNRENSIVVISYGQSKIQRLYIPPEIAKWLTGHQVQYFFWLNWKGSHTNALHEDEELWLRDNGLDFKPHYDNENSFFVMLGVHNFKRPQEKGTTGMNYSRAIFLISEDVIAVNVCYEPPKDEFTKPSTTTFKTFDKDLKAGDYVLVPTDTRHKMTVAQVVETDVDVDVESSVKCEWIIGRVSTIDFDQIKAQEEDAITRIKSAEKKRRQRELRDSLLADMPENEVKALDFKGPKTAA